MAVKYVKDFTFGADRGFTGSVQRYAKGGHVTKLPPKAAASAKGMPPKAQPNAPATGAARMESPPTMGKGQGYAKGGKAMPSKAKASAKGMPAKAKPNAAPSGAKRMESPPSRGKRQGYAEGGRVPGFEKDVEPTKRPPGEMYDLAPSKPFKGEYQGYAKGGRMRRYAEGGDIKDPRAMSIEPGDGGDAYPELIPIPEMQPIEPYNPSPDGRRISGDLLYQWDDGTYHFHPQFFPGQTEDGYSPDMLPPGNYRDASKAALAAKSQPVSGGLDPFGGRPVKDITLPPQPMQPLESLPRPPDELMRADDVQVTRNYLPTQQQQPSRGYLNPVEGLSGIGRAMREGAMRPDMMRRPGMPGERTAMYAKGGQVKGQAKVGKVMSEYKAGELHSGSKKGPLVKNPKQAVAIALSEARKAGAKIPKKEEGGLMASRPAVSKPKSVSVTKVTKTVSDGKDAALNERKMLEFLRSLSKDEVADMMEQRAMKAPSMDPDMPKYRKGGMARKGVPAHKAKAMYGGGKC